MKNKRLIALALVVVLAASMLISCGSTIEPITATLIVTAHDEEVFHMDIEMNYKDPTVLMLVQEAQIVHGLNVVLNDGATDVLDIDEYASKTDANGVEWFWEYKINDVLPESTTGGKANAQLINDGDVIEYVYASFDPASIK